MTMTDLKDKLPSWLTPQIAISFLNFMAITFSCGMIYSTAQGEITRNRQDINDLKSEVRTLRAQDTSIAVLKADTTYIKDTIVRIENRIERIPARPN